MSIAESLNVVRSAAQMLTRDGKVLTFANAEYPLAQFANSYNVDETPQDVEMTDELAVSVENHFEEVNQDTLPIEDDSRASLIQNIHMGLAKTLFTTNNVIIPAIKDMHSYFAGLQSRTRQPEYRVEPFIYSEIHNNPVLVNHVNTRYSAVRPLQEYKTYRLDTISADQIIENIAVNNPHLEQEEVTEWALQMGSEKIEAVWNSLFGSGGQLNMNALPFMTMQAAPFNVDEIALAYFLCGNYMHEPVKTPDEEVDVGTWENTMELLHECFGFYLGRAYELRLQMRERGELILRNEAMNPIETRRAVVIVNNDVSGPWLIAGGDIQAVLGAAVDNPGITLVEQIDKGAASYIKRWLTIYPLIKQAAIDYADRQTRNDVVTTFLTMAREGKIKDLPVDEVDMRMQSALRGLGRDDLKNAYKTFATLIVDVYFPDTNYKMFLEAIDEYGQDFPGATLRELNTQAIITLTAIFLAKQITVSNYTPIIDPNAVADTGGVLDATEEDIDEGIVAVVIDEESAPEAPELVVDDTEVVDNISEVEETEFAGVPEEPVEEDTSDFTGAEEEEDPYADLDDTSDTSGAEETNDTLTEPEEDATAANLEEAEEEETPLA